MNNRQSDFVSEYRAKITEALKIIASLQALHNEAALMNWPVSLVEETAIQGANADIDLSALTAAMSAASSILADISVEELAALYSVRV